MRPHIAIDLHDLRFVLCSFFLQREQPTTSMHGAYHAAGGRAAPAAPVQAESPVGGAAGGAMEVGYMNSGGAIDM